MRGGWVGVGLRLFDRGEKGGGLLLNALTLAHPATHIVLVTCKLVGALASGRDDK